MRPRLFVATLAAAAIAALGGGTLLAGPAGAARAGSTPSSTSLSVSTSTLTLGNDSAALLSVRVTGSPFATPTGSVRIKAGTRVLCDATLSGGSGSCRMENTSLFPGSYSLIATYNGDNVFAASQSGPVSVSVNPALTQPTLAQARFPVAFGQERSDTMTVTVGPALPGEFAPSGPFTVVARINGIPTELCSGNLATGVGDVVANTGTCTLSTDTAVPVGEFTIIAHYAGDGTYASGDTVATAIRVTQGPTTTTLGLPSASLAFDKENGATLSYTVGPPVAFRPSGQVSVSAVSAATGQATPICSGPLAGGAGSCQMTAGQLAPGKYLVTATYGGDASYAGSASAAQPLTITKVPVTKVATKTALTRPHLNVKFGHEQTDPLSVQVTAQNGAKPGGKVTIKNGTVALCTITLKNGKGSCKLKPKRLHAGTYHLVASYPGSATFTKSASAKVALTVTK